MTNLEKIRTMSREELANWLCNLFGADACTAKCPGFEFCRLRHKGLLDWLDAEAGECDE